MREKILVIPKTELYSFLEKEMRYDLNHHYLFFRSNSEYNKIISFITEHQLEGDRDTIENDENFKQIIGYNIIRKRVKVCCNKTNLSYFMVKRTNQKEKRLNTLYSIGIGGHINFKENIYDGIIREINEETGFQLPDKTELEVKESNFNHKLIPIGMINYDLNEVGRVHFGINYVIEVNPAIKVYIKETEKMTGKMVSASVIDKYYSKMETWSQVVCDKLGTINEVEIV